MYNGYFGTIQNKRSIGNQNSKEKQHTEEPQQTAEVFYWVNRGYDGVGDAEREGVETTYESL